jgi:murein DD-endopeptidase MepM/ murein hydrolase activator NlpD
VIHPGQTVPNSVCSYGSENAAYAGREGAAPSLGGMSLSVIYGGGRSTPSGRDYYNLTIRPPAHLTSGGLNFLFPLSIPAAITSAFGWRLHPILGESLFHSGTDLGAPQGTPVLAAFSGKVAIADFMGGYGLAVVLQHDNGTEESLYGHLSEIFVKPGETVKQGEVIGRVGSTGLSTGPHLHFEFRKQTPNGWVVMDAGGALELALSQFVSALKLGLSYPPQLATIRATSFTEALAMAQVKSQAETKQTQEGAAELQSKSKTKPQASQDYSQD